MNGRICTILAIATLVALVIPPVSGSNADDPFDPNAPQQSTTGPVPPLEVEMRDALMMLTAPTSVNGTQHTIDGVPDYIWRHGCGPTAVGMLIGYYDMHGWGRLVPGNSSTQTSAATQMIASGGASGTPMPPGQERHYEDYASPEDDSPTMLIDDYITKGRTPHASDSLADFMRTSRSTASNYYGWSWSSDISPAFAGYVNKIDPAYMPTSSQYSFSSLTWALFTNEVDHGRPMVFLVDSSGDGLTDHFVCVVGYDEGTPHKYGCLDTWAPAGVRWETFQAMGSGKPWGVWGGWTFSLTAIAEPDADISGRVDFRDFAIMSGHWLEGSCGLPNAWCGGADIDRSGNVDAEDLRMIAESWLQ